MVQLLNIFDGIFDIETTVRIALSDFLLCIAVSLVSGFILAFLYTIKCNYTKSFVVALAILPAVVCVIIMMVNGNVGTGVAVAGAFSLVRFRSVPGTAKEIGALFIAMGSGLIFGIGYLGFGVVFVLILSIVTLLYTYSSFGEKKVYLDKTMTVTMPEDLNYTDVFNDIFDKYTNYCNQVLVKTTNMGSLFKITYNLQFKKAEEEKEFIDEIRCRNGNLEITISPLRTEVNEL